MVVHKPAGMLSHPNPGKRVNSAFEGTYYYHDRRFDTPAGPVWLIHRLDQDASGVLLAARDRRTVSGCRSAFDRFEVEKIYLTLLVGRPIPPRGSWRDHLEERKRADYVRSFLGRGKPNAELRYSTKRSFPHLKLSLVEIKLVTGKTHQIRIQAAAHGHPVSGDRVYGNFALNRKLRQTIGLRRIFLHASSLSFRHPVTKKFLRIEAPIPEELEQVLSRAR